MSAAIQTNEICKVQTNKKLISFQDKLRLAPVERYAQIHSRAENVNGSKMRPSLICVTIQDYSRGSGEQNTIVKFNLAPEECQFFLTRVNAALVDFDWVSQKIYGEPDRNGMSIAESFHISRHQVDSKGQILNSPWQVSISNGHGIRIQNKNGGYYMKGGSYREERSASINLSDMDMYKCLKRVDSFIRVFENSAEVYSLIADGKKAFDAAIAARQNQNQAATPAAPSSQLSYSGGWSAQPQAYPQAVPQPGWQQPSGPQGQTIQPQIPVPQYPSNYDQSQPASDDVPAPAWQESYQPAGWQPAGIDAPFRN